jgi:hypothetical protein
LIFKNHHRVLLQEEKHRFRREGSFVDCIFTTAQLIHKIRKFNLEMHILFVEYIKAFDRILCRKLWDIMTEKGYPDHIMQIIKYMKGQP